MVCLLEGRGEGEKANEGRGRTGEEEGRQARKLFTCEEPQWKRACVCVWARVCAGAETMQVKKKKKKNIS